jgi:predicted phage terminase large subunit-like protein
VSVLTSEIIKNFSESFLAEMYDEPTPIPQFHEEMWALCTSDYRKIAIAAPRGHAKSTAITFAYAMACIVFGVHDHVLIISASESIASQFVKAIKIQFLENEKLMEYFKFKKLIKDTDTEIIGLFEDGREFRIIGKGANQSMRGTIWRHKRPNLVLCDDMEDDEMVLNDQTREKFKSWFFSAIRPIISKTGEIRIVGTIMHMASLLESLMPKEKDPATVFDPLKTFSNKLRSGWLGIKYRAHDTTFEHILWPDRFSAADLRSIRGEFADQMLLDKYAQEYLNDPIDASVSFFKDEDFKESPSNAEWPRREKSYFAGGDFAVGTSHRHDATAFVVVSLDSDGKLEVEHARRGNWDSLEIIQNMFEIQKKYKPKIFTVEQGTIEKALGPFLNLEMRSKNTYLNLKTMVPSRDKEARAASIRGRMRVGDVYFRKEEAWWPDFYEELRRFPKGLHDDYVDAFAYIGLTLDQMGTTQTKEEREEEEWMEKYNKYNVGQGADPTTGY